MRFPALLVGYVGCFHSRLTPFVVLDSKAIVYYAFQSRTSPHPKGKVGRYPGKRTRRLGKWVRSGLDGHSHSYIAFARDVNYLSAS